MKDLKLPGEIPGAVARYAEEHGESRRKFCSWLEPDGEDVIQRVFAYKYPKGKKVMITECIRKHSLGPETVRNIYYTGFAGYQIVFERKDVYCSSGGYPFLVFGEEDFDVWYDGAGFKACNVDSVVLNLDALAKTRYKYCGFAGNGADLMRHLESYDANPVETELFSKMGLRLQPSLMKRAREDGQFRRFLYENRHEIYLYGAVAAEYAFKHKISVEEARRITAYERYVKVNVGRAVPSVRGTKIDRIKLDEYINDTDCGYGAYDDYLKAIKYLKLDLSDTKNVFPKDFKRMHDLRIDEYASKLVKADLKARSKLEKKFRKAAELARPLAEYADGEYVAIIPQQISDLVREGELLHHCVGRMGYDKKMADGASLIVFVRRADDIGRPLVTVEFDLKKLGVKQAYGDHDSKPKEREQKFVDAWETRAKEVYGDLRASERSGARAAARGA